MIKKLTITNYQSHKETKLKFHKGINVIIGPSDSGKTAILRALNWVVNNKPGGDSFRSNWGGDTIVQLKTKKGEVIRSKEKTNNLYTIISSDKEKGLVFKAFGQAVPEEIKQLLNFSSLNLQEQFDSPFLLAMSAGEVAKYLNKIVHLDKIDISLSNINSTLRKEKSDLTYLETELINTKEKSEYFNWLDEAEGCLLELEILESNLKQKTKEHNTLVILNDEIMVYDKKIKKINEITKYEKEVELLLKQDEELQKKKRKILRLNMRLNDIKIIELTMASEKESITKNQKLFSKYMPNICPLCGK